MYCSTELRALLNLQPALNFIDLKILGRTSLHGVQFIHSLGFTLNTYNLWTVLMEPHHLLTVRLVLVNPGPLQQDYLLETVLTFVYQRTRDPELMGLLQIFCSSISG